MDRPILRQAQDEGNGTKVDEYPLTQPSPPRGRGLRTQSPLPVGEGWVRALFFFRLPREDIHPTGHYPPERKGLGPRLRGEDGWMRSGTYRPSSCERGRGKALFSYLFRFPREGGDPDPFAPAGSGKPAQPSASLRGASRRSNPGEHHVRPVSAPWVASLHSQ